jgi:hypothetical protein
MFDKVQSTTGLSSRLWGSVYMCVCYIHTPTYIQICRYSLLDLPVTKVGMTLRVETQPKFVYRNIKTVLKTDDRQVFQVLGLDVMNKSEFVNGGVSVPRTPSPLLRSDSVSIDD